MTTSITSEEGVLVISGSIAVQNGVPMLLGFAKAQPLTEAATVDTFDPETNLGYQRTPMSSRIRQAADYYDKGGRMPNPLLLNLRDDDLKKVVLEVSDQAAFDAACESDGNWIGTGRVIIKYAEVKIKVYVYDGQHRNGAVDQLVEANPEEFGDFPVPVSLTLGLDDLEEMKEFYEVNNNAKSVKVDLAWELLRKMAAEDAELAEFLEVSNQDWKTKGADVTDSLIESGGLWSDKIQRANVKKVRADNLVLNISQFVRSLQPVLAMPALKKADADQIAVVIDAYWKGIQKVLPEPFTEPKKYVLQKGPGAIAFHRVLPQVIEVLRARGERLGDADAYARVLQDLPNLSGEVVHEDGRSEMVTGPDFWLSGPEGVASQWTGDAGRKRLAVRIQALLPRPSDDLNL
jgi:DGQHR domain-containing protein